MAHLSIPFDQKQRDSLLDLQYCPIFHVEEHFEMGVV